MAPLDRAAEYERIIKSSATEWLGGCDKQQVAHQKTSKFQLDRYISVLQNKSEFVGKVAVTLNKCKGLMDTITLCAVPGVTALKDRQLAMSTSKI